MLQSGPLFPGADIPETDLARLVPVATAGGQCLAIGREHHGPCFTSVCFEGEDFFSALAVPHADMAIADTRSDRLGIRRQCDGADFTLLEAKGLNRFKVAELSHLDRVV